MAPMPRDLQGVPTSLHSGCHTRVAPSATCRTAPKCHCDSSAQSSPNSCAMPLSSPQGCTHAPILRSAFSSLSSWALQALVQRFPPTRARVPTTERLESISSTAGLNPPVPKPHTEVRNLSAGPNMQPTRKGNTSTRTPTAATSPLQRVLARRPYWARLPRAPAGTKPSCTWPQKHPLESGGHRHERNALPRCGRCEFTTAPVAAMYTTRSPPSPNGTRERYTCS